MTGFQGEIKDKILDVDSHITVSATRDGGGHLGLRRPYEKDTC